MKDILALIKRNTKLFFKDKGLFFTSMVTPLILLLLYTTFLGKVYRDSLTMSIAQGIVISESIIEGIVGGQLFSSLLAVSCVTVAFCSNMLMVQDKMSGARNDLLLTPVKKGKMAIAYYFSTLISTLIVAVFALIACFIYLAIVGWYLSFMDILLLVLDILLLTSFGTVLSSIINCFLSTQGQISAVGTIVSAGYGFICGAYMPISTFSAGLQNAIAFLPGTYGTALMRTHALSGAFEKMLAEGVPLEAVEGIKSSVDCSVSFFGNTVSEPIMYLVLGGSVVLLIGVYILIHKLTIKKK
jgi:multidrug/hemolysin transport system permease protein